MLLLSVALAGELANLHRKLAVTEVTAPFEAEVPGVRAIGGPVPTPTVAYRRIGLERTPCLGRCPVYTVIIEQDGAFVYDGVAHVERIGRHRGRVNTAQLAQVFRYIDEIDFFNLADSYRAELMDEAAAYTLVESAEATKVVMNYARTAPATVWALEELIDALLATATWEAGGGER